MSLPPQRRIRQSECGPHAGQSRSRVHRIEAAWLDPALSIVAIDGPLELRVTRADYDEPLTLTRTLPGGGSEVLDSNLLEGWRGLKRLHEDTDHQLTGRGGESANSQLLPQ